MISPLSTAYENKLPVVSRQSQPQTGQRPDPLATGTGDRVTLSHSTSANLLSAVDNVYNLNGPRQLDSYRKLSADDKKQFVQIVSALATTGYMGYEDLVVKNRVERHNATTEIGDQRLHGARVYRDPKRAGH